MSPPRGRGRRHNGHGETGDIGKIVAAGPRLIGQHRLARAVDDDARAATPTSEPSARKTIPAGSEPRPAPGRPTVGQPAAGSPASAGRTYRPPRPAEPCLTVRPERRTPRRQAPSAENTDWTCSPPSRRGPSHRQPMA